MSAPNQERLRRDGPTNDRFVFVGALKMFKRAGEAAKLPFGIHPHMFRHAAGHRAVNDGVATRTVQHILGHKNIALRLPASAMSALHPKADMNQNGPDGISGLMHCGPLYR
jgi:integrase